MNDTVHPTEVLLTQVDWIRALAFELVRDGGEAEDLAQATILQALEHPPREIGALRGFLRSVLRNEWLQRARSESRRREREARAARAEALPATDELVERLALHRRVVEVVEELQEPYRSAILLRFFDRLPPREIARRRGLSVRTVDTHIQRALAQLRARFDDEHENDRRRWARALLPLLGCFRPEPRPSSASPGARWIALVGALATAAVLWTILAPRDPRSGTAATAVAAEGGRTGPGALAEAEAPASERAPVAPEPRARLAGTVRAVGGEPVAGAEVDVRFLPSATFAVTSGSFPRASSSLGRTATDAQGRFVLELAASPSARPLRVVVSAAGFGTVVRDDVHEDEPLDLQLARAGRFEFTVLTDEDGLPCSGARIVLSSPGRRDPTVEGATDARGLVAIVGLAPGLYTIEATPLAAARVFAIDLVLRAGETVARTLRAGKAAPLAGLVQSARTGRPVAGARVRSVPDHESVTDEAGRFRLE